MTILLSNRVGSAISCVILFQWKIIHASKPDPNVNHPDDVAAIEQAKNTIGDYKLKLSPNYSKSQEKRETTLTKYKEIMDCRKKVQLLNSRRKLIL